LGDPYRAALGAHDAAAKRVFGFHQLLSMSRIRTILTQPRRLLPVIALALVAPTVAADNANKPTSAPVHVAGQPKFAKGLLWKISPPHGEPSYLFGTMHSPDPRVTRLAPVVQAVFDRAASFTMELLINANGVATMAEAMFFPPGQNLRAVLGPELYAQARQAIIDHGLSTRDLERKKPWVIVMLLSQPRAEPGLPLDIRLQLQATLQGKPTYGLETMSEQISVFNDLSIADQVELLRDTLAVDAEVTRQFEALIQAYVDRDLTRLMAIVDEPKRQRSPAFTRMMDRLLSQRNDIMLKRMRTRLDEGNAFIAIGAAHLSGDDGLLQLLEKVGYRVSAVY
jgi:uncharacterized protein YbaP (TraB family)